MFCPRCRDEFRPGFTRCADCDVDLVDSLDAAPPPVAARAAVDKETQHRAAQASLRFVDFCGFFDLDEARRARERLRAAEIAAVILICDAPSQGDGPPAEEYWLRVESTKVRPADRLLAEFDATTGDLIHCAECGASFAPQEAFCPGCGHRREGSD